MIIDIHAHWWPSKDYMISEDGWKIFLQGLNMKFYKPAGVSLKNEELEDYFFDPEGEKLIAEMEKAGTDKTVILPLDWGCILGEPNLDIIEQNKAYAKLASKRPDKIIAFFSINPLAGKSPEHFKTAVDEWGMKGLKLYPPTGFYPYDDSCTPYYKICLEHDLPVIYHGSTSSMSKTEFSHPDHFSVLAANFPGLKIVLAHAGGNEWRDQAIKACLYHKNIYLDISGWQLSGPHISKNISLLYSNLGSFDKVMFGTDGPIFNGMMKTKAFIWAIRKSDVPEDELDKLFVKSAKGILCL
jgi:uncharacterized protein